RLRLPGSILGEERQSTEAETIRRLSRIYRTIFFHDKLRWFAALHGADHRHLQSSKGSARFHLWTWLPELESVCTQEFPNQRKVGVPVQHRRIQLRQPSELGSDWANRRTGSKPNIRYFRTSYPEVNHQSSSTADCVAVYLLKTHP